MQEEVVPFYKKYRIELIIFLIGLPYIIAQNMHGGDFRILLRGAEILRTGVSPYGIVMPIDGEVTDVFLYSPFVGFILLPATYLPEIIPTFIFSIFNFLLLFRTWTVMSKWLNTAGLLTEQKKWWYILSVVLILRFILHNFEKSQMNIVVFYFAFEGLYQILMQKKWAGGILLALGICLKILPIIFLPYLVYRKKVSATFVAVLFCGLFLLLPAIWFGMGFEVQLLKGWWTAINPIQDKYNAQQNTDVYFHCITALIPVYFSDCSYHGFSVNIINLQPSKLLVLINITRAALVCFTVYFLWANRSAKKVSDLACFWELSYLFLLIPLIFPHQQKYSYINLLPAFGYLAYYIVNIYVARSVKIERDKKGLLTMLAVIVIFTSLTADVIWGMKTGKYFQFMKLVTVGTLIIIPVLAYFSPMRLYKTTPAIAQEM